MAKTPYGKLGSQDILSAHLNGLQYGVNNVEEVLDMKTATKTGQVLQPVNDMDDPTLRYRIYEAGDRNWLTDPAPVIYRDGEPVNASEYEVQPAYGVVIFIVQQDTNATITADFTHVINGSTRIDGIEADIATNTEAIISVANDVGTVNNRVDGLNTRVTKLEENGTGGGAEIMGGSLILTPHDVIDYTNQPLYLTNLKIGKTLADATPTSVGVAQLNRALDVVPIYVEQQTTVDAIRFLTNSTTGSSDVMGGIYTNKDWQPFELIAKTGTHRVEGETDTVMPLDEPITLHAGLYWVARYYNSLTGSNSLSCLGYTMDAGGAFVEINAPAEHTDGTSGIVFGYRTSLGLVTELPTVHPTIAEGAKFLRRGSFGLIYLRRKLN